MADVGKAHPVVVSVVVAAAAAATVVLILIEYPVIPVFTTAFATVGIWRIGLIVRDAREARKERWREVVSEQRGDRWRRISRKERLQIYRQSQPGRKLYYTRSGFRVAPGEITNSPEYKRARKRVEEYFSTHPTTTSDRDS